LAAYSCLAPQQLSDYPQVAFHNPVDNSFSHWASGAGGEETIICSVNTAQAALDLVAAGVGLCLMSEDCMQDRADVRFVPLKNWHQALYMCILYDKWLEPPVWAFVEQLIKVLRDLYPHEELR
jgi:DNA-binding transcriptional LysR family regulator